MRFFPQISVTCRVNIVNFLPGVSEGDRVDLAYFVFAGSMLSVSPGAEQRICFTGAWANDDDKYI